MNKKTIIISSIAIVTVCAGIFAGYFYLEQSTPELKKKKYVFEYGEEINLDKKTILETENQEIIDSIKFDLSKLKLEEDKDYPSVGSYTVNVSYDTLFQKQTKKLKIEVKDTTKPDFKKTIDEIMLSVGESEHDFHADFEISDLSEAKLDFDFESVDFNQPGEYEAKAIAQDKYENKSEKSFKIIVQKLSEAETSTTTQENVDTNTAPTSSAPTYVNGIMIVNKKHGLPASYAPGEDATAGSQIRRLIADMQAQGYSISSSYSGYRSYDYQNGLYWNYVNGYGQAQADTFSARAGYSEHQTGLAFDLIHSNGSLVTTNPEVDWIAANAHNYGFIVRYQYGKESITGYQAEPWHLRYVGDAATSIYQSGLTLEEYLGVPGGGY